MLTPCRAFLFLPLQNRTLRGNSFAQNPDQQLEIRHYLCGVVSVSPDSYGHTPAKLPVGLHYQPFYSNFCLHRIKPHHYITPFSICQARLLIFFSFLLKIINIYNLFTLFTHFHKLFVHILAQLNKRPFRPSSLPFFTDRIFSKIFDNPLDKLEIMCYSKSTRNAKKWE